MADSGLTQINDIVLSIPPESIQVLRRSFNYEWQTLRTRSSMKTKSGFSSLDIVMTVKFTDDKDGSNRLLNNGYRKLRALVSQFRTTPFCFVENQFLRNSILGGRSGQTMALVLKQLEITKTGDSANVITGTFVFSWFNYFPFAKNFTFKRDIFVGDEVTNPADSNAWKLLYRAEQQRNEYLQVDQLHTSTRLTYNEFATLPVKDYNRLQKEVQVLTKLKQQLLASGPNDHTGEISEQVRRTIEAELANESWSNQLLSDIFGDQTSMNGSNDIDGPTEADVKKEVLRVIDGNLRSDAEAISRYDLIVNSEWKPVVLNDNKLVRFQSEPGKPNTPKENEIDKSTTVLLRRAQSLHLEAAGLITQGITISFENIVATMPMLGHAYPTFQHVGSIDGRITLSIITTDEQSVARLSSLYTTIEDQARKFRMIPVGQRNLSIENDLVNMCGLRDTIPDSLIIETVQGTPGCYAAALTLVDNPIDANTAEKFSTESSLSNNGDLRLKVASVLERNLKLVSEIFVKDSNGKLTLRPLKQPEFILGSSPDPELGSVVTVVGTKGGEAGYYTYAGQANERKLVFRQLCEDYGRQLGNLLANVFPVIVTAKESPVTAGRSGTHRNADMGRIVSLATFTPEDFFVLTNQDSIGVEKIQNDISDAIEGVAVRKDLGNILSSTDDPSITPAAQQRVAQTENFFKVYNAIRGARVRPETEDIKVLPESEGQVAQFRKDDRVRLLLETYFTDWSDFCEKFFDKITHTNLINLPEFADIRKEMTEKAIQSGAEAYPDFPLKEVVDSLQASKGSNLQNSYRKLVDMFSRTGLSDKHLSLSVLLNPDFYFYNPQNDVQETIIPTNVMQKAAESIKKSREMMEPAERDWFQGVYKANIVGEEKFNRTKEILDENHKSADFATFMKTSPGSWYKQAFESSYSSSAVAPNLLTGDVGPSLSEISHVDAPDKKRNEVTIKGSSIKTDTHNSRSNHNGEQQLSGDDQKYAVRHRFETGDCLDNLPETAYLPPRDEPNLIPILIWPTDTTCRRITSREGARAQPVAGGSTDHPGIDIAVAVRKTPPTKEDSAGQKVYAVADGVIKTAYFHPNYGFIISIAHTGNMVTRYVHLALDPTTTYWEDLVGRKGVFEGLDDEERKFLLTVSQGQEIGSIGPTAPVSTAAHLHFEVYVNGQRQNPERYLPSGTPLAGEAYKSRGPIKGIEPQNDSLLSKSVEQFQRDLHAGQGYSMMRAYPTFKLYFIESDAGERKRYAFDDFFSYSSVKEIMVIRSRKIAADLAVIQLTNLSGRLTNRKFSSSLQPTKPKDSQGQDATEEGPIESLMLQPGVQIQLRLGYSNNPEELETVFNGTITDLEFTETDDLVTITCQSFATEMVQTVQGEVKSFGGLFDGDGRTFRILEELMASPELVHFGRWEGGNVGINSQRGLLTNRWRLVPTPSDDNIFAPVGKNSLGFIDSFVSTTEYKMYQTTVWDVFQEMTLRHPSYIACAVPYEGRYGPRMTMFFGLPDQLYFARDSSDKEDDITNTLRDVVKNGTGDHSEAAIQQIRDSSTDIDADKLEEFMDSELHKKTAEERERWFQLLSKQYALGKGYIRPFRNYHLLTSSLHIMYNSISSSSHNAFNTVTLQYGDSSPGFDEDTAELNFDNLKTLTLRADEAIPDEETRESFEQFPNCVGYEMAKQYAVGCLFNYLKEAYKGEIVIIGNPKIKPYDVCYVFDEYTDMFGPVEVEQVVHRFSQQTGFITEITPDMMVHVNQHATLSTNDAMGLIAEHAIKSIGIQPISSLTAATSVAAGIGIAAAAGASIPLVVGASALAVANWGFSPIAAMFFNSSENSLGQQGDSTAFGLVGGFIFRKLITRTQLAHPFRFSPLTLNGHPMIGGLPNRRSDGTFVQQIGKWFKDHNKGVGLILDETMDRIHPNNWLGQLGEGDLRTLLPGGQ